MKRLRGLAVDAVGNQNRDAPRADAPVARTREQRERRRLFDFRLVRTFEGFRKRFGQRHAELVGKRCGELRVHVGEHRNDALADSRHLDLGELEAKAAHDVRLFDGRLTVPEERRLRVVIGEALGFAPHLVGFDAARETT